LAQKGLEQPVPAPAPGYQPQKEKDDFEKACLKLSIEPIANPEREKDRNNEREP
jgi:hypothetical protein